MSPRVGEPRRRTLEVRLTDREFAALDRVARERGVSKSELTRFRLAQDLGVRSGSAGVAAKAVEKPERPSEPVERPLPTPSQVAGLTQGMYPPARAAAMLKAGKVSWDGAVLVVDGRRFDRG